MSQSVEEMRKIIRRGESVLHGGTVISKEEDLPDEFELAMGDAGRVAAAKQHIARERARLAEQEAQLEASLEGGNTTTEARTLRRQTETTYGDRRVNRPVISDDHEDDDLLVTHGDSTATRDGSMNGMAPQRTLEARRDIEDTHPTLGTGGQRDIGGLGQKVAAGEEEQDISRRATRAGTGRTASRSANRAAAASARASESSTASDQGTSLDEGSETGAGGETGRVGAQTQTLDEGRPRTIAEGADATSAPLGNSGLTGQPALGAQTGPLSASTGSQGGPSAGSEATAPAKGPANSR